MLSIFKKTLSTVALVAMILTLCLAFSSCNKKDDGTTPDSGKIDKIKLDESYFITRPDGADTAETYLTKELKNAIKDASGLSLTVKSDWLKPGDPVPEKEILIGETERAQSKAVYEKLAENQWAVTVKDGKFIIAGKGNRALDNAVNYFIDTYVKGKTVVEIEADAEKYDTVNIVYFSWEDEECETVKVTNGGCYPRLYKLQDGRLMCARDGIKALYSSDDGLTWRIQGKDPTISFFNGYACANPAIYQAPDGEIFVSYRAVGMDGDKYYRGIHCSSSKDGGKTWQKAPDIIVTCNDGEGGVWEPHFFTIDGVLTVAYANDDEEYVTPPYQHLEYKQLINGEWTNRTIMANGEDHKSRDGMPYVIQLRSGEYVCAFEGWKTGTPQLIPKLIYSADGKTWSEPVVVYTPNEVNGGAPAVAELPSGQLVVSYQSSENCKCKQGDCTHMYNVVSDGTPIQYITSENFSAPVNTFNTPEGYNAMWNALYTTDEYLYAITGTGYPSGQLRLHRYAFKDMLKDVQKEKEE